MLIFGRFIVRILLVISILGIAFFGGGAHLSYVWPFIGLLGILVCAEVFCGRQQDTTSRSCLLTLVAACGYFSWRALTSDVQFLADPDLALILSATALYYIVVFKSAEIEFVGTLCVIIGGLITANVLIGFIQVFRDHTFFVWKVFGLDYTRPVETGSQLSGLYGNYNHCAAFFSMALPLCLAQTICGRLSVNAKIALGFVSALGILGLGYTGSRGGILSATIGLLFLMVMLGYHSIRYDKRFTLSIAKWLTLPVCIVGGIALWSVITSFSIRFSDNHGFMGSKRPEQRWYLWESAISQAKESPSIGNGSRSFQYMIGKHWPEPIHIRDRTPLFVHNEYLQALCEYGVIGLILLSGLAIIHLLTAARSFFYFSGLTTRNRNFLSTKTALNAGCVGALSAAIVHAFVDFNLHIAFNLVLISLVCACVAGPGHAAQRLGVRRNQRVWTILLAQLFPLLVGIALMALYANSGHFATSEEYKRYRAKIDRVSDFERVAILRTLALENPLNPDLPRELGLLNLGKGFEERLSSAQRSSYNRRAIEYFDQALAIYPYDKFCMYYQGIAYLRLSQQSEARKSFRLFSEWAKGDGGAAYGEALCEMFLGDHAFREGNSPQAVSYYENAQALEVEARSSLRRMAGVNDLDKLKEMLRLRLDKVKKR